MFDSHSSANSTPRTPHSQSSFIANLADASRFNLRRVLAQSLFHFGRLADDNENQIIEALRETRAFVNSNVSLQDKLAGVLMTLGGKALDDVAGLSPEEIGNFYEIGRQRLVALLGRFDKVLATGGHELTSLILSLSNVEINELTPILRDIANATGEARVGERSSDRGP